MKAEIARSFLRGLMPPVHVLANLGLIALSTVVSTVLLEVALPFFVEVTDRIDYVAVPGVGLGLRPNQDGLFIRTGVRARFHINGAGFNNAREYVPGRRPGVARIAVVGDSFVEALHVNQDQALFSILEEGLAAGGTPSEVLGFGISGYGTSQVFRLVQETVVRYSPDLVVYLFIRNDLSDSSPCLDRQPWTQQYELSEDGALTPLPVGHYEVGNFSSLLRRSRLFRYIFYQRRLLERIRAHDRGRGTRSGPGASECVDHSWRIVEALLKEMRRQLEGRGIQLLVVWQGDSDPEYAADIRTGLERIVAGQGIEFFDPTPAFQGERRGTRENFRIAGDGHWNADGHRVVGTALVPRVEQMLGGHGTGVEGAAGREAHRATGHGPPDEPRARPVAAGRLQTVRRRGLRLRRVSGGARPRALEVPLGLVDDGVPRQLLDCEPASSLPHQAAAVRRPQEAGHGIGQKAGVARRDEDTRDAVPDDVGNAADPAGHHRDPGRLGLAQGPTHGFCHHGPGRIVPDLDGGLKIQVEPTVELGKLVLLEVAEKVDAGFQGELACERTQARFLGPGPGDTQARLRRSFPEQTEHVQRDVDPLDGQEVAGETENAGIGTNGVNPRGHIAGTKDPGVDTADHEVKPSLRHAEVPEARERIGAVAEHARAGGQA